MDEKILGKVAREDAEYMDVMGKRDNMEVRNDFDYGQMGDMDKMEYTDVARSEDIK